MSKSASLKPVKVENLWTETGRKVAEKYNSALQHRHELVEKLRAELLALPSYAIEWCTTPTLKADFLLQCWAEALATVRNLREEEDAKAALFRLRTERVNRLVRFPHYHNSTCAIANHSHEQKHLSQAEFVRDLGFILEDATFM